MFYFFVFLCICVCVLCIMLVLFYVCADVFHVLLLCMFSCFIAWILFVFSDQQAPVFWPFFNLFLFLWLVLFYVCANVLLLCMFSCFIAWILCSLFGPVLLAQLLCFMVFFKPRDLLVVCVCECVRMFFL